MKKIYYLVALMAIVFTSCEDFLNEELKGEYTSNTIFKSKEAADYALTGVYNSLSFTSADNRIWVFGDVASDDALKGGASGDQTDIGYISDFNVKSDNGILQVYWKYVYEAISRSNNVIHGDFGGDIDDASRAAYIAQAKFARAYYYFNLVNIWGKVPLRLEPNKPSNINKPLSEVSDIYASIESDLTDAASVLPATYSNSADAGKITKGAVLGLLAKAQLYQKKWLEAINTITQLQALNIYGLETKYSTLFKLGSENSKEAVFAIRHLSNQNPGVGNSLNQWFAPSVNNGYYFDVPTQSFVSCFDEKTIYGTTDPRLDVTVGQPGQDWFDSGAFDADWSPTGYLNKKHNQPLSEVPAGIKGDGGLAYLYMRYADVLLMLSEAYAETNQLQKAVDALNLVRSRADLNDVTPITQQQMLTTIYLERRRELGFEFHRFFDLMRWGKDVAKQALGPNFQWQDPRYYFPLPQSELDANHGI